MLIQFLIISVLSPLAANGDVSLDLKAWPGLSPRAPPSPAPSSEGPDG